MVYLSLHYKMLFFVDDFLKNSNIQIQNLCGRELRSDLILKDTSSSTEGITRSSVNRGGSRTAATPKMERFVIIVNGWKPLTIITKHSILDGAAVLDPPLVNYLRIRKSEYSRDLLRS